MEFSHALPTDVAFRRLRTDPRVVTHILPSVKSKAAGATEKGDNVATGSVVERPIEKAKARKPPTKKASAMCPAELKVIIREMRIIMRTFVGPSISKEAAKRKLRTTSCKKGVHKCASASCLRTGHGLATCKTARKATA